MKLALLALSCLVFVSLVCGQATSNDRYNEEHVKQLDEISKKLSQFREDKEKEYQNLKNERNKQREELEKEKQRLQEQLKQDREKQFQQVKKTNVEQHEQFKGILQQILTTVDNTEEKKLGFHHMALLENISRTLESSKLDTIRHFEEIQEEDEAHHNQTKQKIVEDHETVQTERNQQFKELTEMKGNQQKELHSMFKKIMKRLDEPKDCYDIYQSGNTKSGMYLIKPKGVKENFYVLCDMDKDGGGWTVIQRREKTTGKSEPFNRTWDDYKKGFGQFTGDFWLGNDRISALTTQKDMVLKVDMQDATMSPLHGTFKRFRVEDESTNYLLQISDYDGKITQVFTNSNGQSFSTQDKNTSAEMKCAILQGSGWWFAKNCINTANLNGFKEKGLTALDGQTPIVYSVMKVRPAPPKPAKVASVVDDILGSF